ncbi:delta-lactam-biosynthetic de-N-acetylase [Hathewaya histolytica]|uniref:Chitooligosaccharide deacetylase n=1 Tax=Hathewaya histolytica TaxID=1498 RepID=A0A4V6KCP0_HATHI|nr:delta-lactam-biosynthetic de-N-acetylase [Hathewaya histolytica]VTQ85997.1 chitooligosaccharide deacetylase [Hathewaya histolytica]
MSKFYKKFLVSLLIVTGICGSFMYYTKNYKSINKLINTQSGVGTQTVPENSKAVNSSSLSTKEYNWYFKHVENGKPPLTQPETKDFISKYDTHFLGDTSKKVIYITFDEGYENGYTAPILDVLKKHNVKASFFVVKPYIDSNHELIKRMVDEGHMVCNHSNHHPSMASIHDKDKFNKELSDVEEAFEKLTGKKMSKYFRPPMGKYSERSLAYTKDYGYKTIFWSFAYADWDTKKQPSHSFAKKKILDKTHNGAIMLLHAVSKTNAEILDDVITEWKNQGYEIRPLSDI